MSDEEKKKAEELAAAARASEQKKNEVEIDYKAELEKIRKEKEAKEKELSQAQHVIESLKRKKEEVDEDDDTPPAFDQEAIFKIAREEARKEVERAQSGFAKDSLEDAIAAASSDPAEQELIRFHYENSLKQSGYSRTAILEDIQKAKVLANKPKLERMEKELARGKFSKQTSSSGSGSYHDTNHDVDLSPEEEDWIQKAAASTGQAPDKIKAKLIANKTR